MTRQHDKIPAPTPLEGTTRLGKIFDKIVSPKVQVYLFPDVQLSRRIDRLEKILAEQHKTGAAPQGLSQGL